MKPCETCEFAVNHKNSPSNPAWQCHFNPPGQNGWAQINRNDAGCSFHSEGADDDPEPAMPLPAPRELIPDKPKKALGRPPKVSVEVKPKPKDE